MGEAGGGWPALAGAVGARATRGSRRLARADKGLGAACWLASFNMCLSIQIKLTQDELQWIVAQRLLSALTIPGFS